MRSSLVCLQLALLSACGVLRTDARIRQGVHAGAASNVVWTPEAKITVPDERLGVPKYQDGANFRGHSELQLGYGWGRGDFTLHLLFHGWTSPHDYSSSDRSVVLPRPMALDLYRLVAERDGWSFGIGYTLPLYAYGVVTRELSPSHAVTLTLASGVSIARAQLAWSVRSPHLDVALFAGATARHDGDELDLSPSPPDYNLDVGPYYLSFGLKITAH
jgi:hypothetical protein